MTQEYTRIAKVLFSARGANGMFYAALADLEQGMTFGSANGATREEVLINAAKEIINGAGGTLTHEQITSGCLLVVGGDEAIDTPIDGLDIERAKRVIAAANFA